MLQDPGGGRKLVDAETVLINVSNAYPAVMTPESQECLHQGLRVVHVLAQYMPSYLEVRSPPFSRGAKYVARHPPEGDYVRMVTESSFTLFLVLFRIPTLSRFVPFVSNYSTISNPQ